MEAENLLKPILPDRAQKLLLTLPVRLKVQRLPLKALLGRALAEDVTAALPVPPFCRSPYDGFALRAEDVRTAARKAPVRLRILEEIPAGKVPDYPLKTGTASRIMTGAPLPHGADCVLKWENAAQTGRYVDIFTPARSGQNVVQAGEDAPIGTLLLRRGDVLGPGELGELAAQGISACRVFRRPIAVLIPTGGELAEPGMPLTPGKIYDSGRFVIGGFLRQMGFSCRESGPVPDDPAQIVRAIAASDADVVITTGGASSGDFDFAFDCARRLEYRVLFRKVLMRPGGTMLAGVKNGKLLLCLSGNPGAAAVGLLRIAAPCLRRLCGYRTPFAETVQVALKEPLTKDSPVTRLLRGQLSIENGRALFLKNGRQSGGAISSLCGFDLLGEIPAGSPPLPAGSEIRAYRLF